MKIQYKEQTPLILITIFYILIRILFSQLHLSGEKITFPFLNYNLTNNTLMIICLIILILGICSLYYLGKVIFQSSLWKRIWEGYLRNRKMKVFILSLLFLSLIGDLYGLFFVFPFETWRLKIEVLKYLDIILFTSIFLLTFKTNWSQKILTVSQPIKEFILKMDRKYFILLFMIIGVSIPATISWFLLDHIPHNSGAADYLFQAKIFKQGKFYVEYHPYKDFFEHDNMVINNGKWYIMQTPGWPILLVFGLLFDCPWLINPMLFSLTLLLFYLIGKNIYSDRIGRISVCLALVSPFLVFRSSEMLAHPSNLLFISLFVYLFIKIIKGGGIIYAFLCGLAGGFSCFIRPIESVGVIFPFAIYFIYLTLSKKINGWKFISVTIGYFLMVTGWLFYNYKTSGHPFLTGYNVAAMTLKLSPLYEFGKLPEVSLLGGWGFRYPNIFGWEKDVTLMHTPLTGMIIGLSRYAILNKDLFEWPIPSYSIIFLLFLLTTKKSINIYSRLFIASLFSLLIFYLPMKAHSDDGSARYFFLAILPLILLTAKGLNWDDDRNLKGLLSEKMLVLIVLCELWMVVIGLPQWVNLYSNSYRYVNTQLRDIVIAKDIKNAVVFIKDENLPGYIPRCGFIFNDKIPLEKNSVIYARDLGKKNHLLMDYYPTRKYYLYSRDPKNNQPLFGEILNE